MDDLISRNYAIKHYQHVCRRTNCNECPLHIQVTDTLTDCELELFLHNLPSAEPDRYMVTMAESMDIDRLKGIITKPSDITLIPLPKAEQKWIPVTERLPVIENNVGKRVLVTTSWGMVGEATYCKDHWEINDFSYKITGVLAWMPLPEPWKGEGDE